MSDSIPLDALPRRSQTLESNRQGIDTSNDQAHDKVYDLLTKRLQTINNEKRVETSTNARHLETNAKSSSQIDDLRLHYARIKDRPAAQPQQCEKPSRLVSLLRPQHAKYEMQSCDTLFSYWRLNAPGFSIVSETQIEATRVQSGDTFSNWACRLAVYLESQQQDTLQLVRSMTEFPEAEHTRFMFSSWHYFVATILGRLGTMHHSPVRIMLATIAHCWGIEMVSGSAPSDSMDPASFSLPKPLRPPSLRSAKESGEQRVPHPRIVWGHGSTRPGNLDPLRGDHEILLTWKRDVTRFESDLTVYIWEYHTSIPEVEYAKIILQPENAVHGQLRLLISFRSSSSNEHFIDMRNLTTKKNLSNHLSNTAVEHISWSPIYEVLISICVVIELMIADTTEFLDACHDEVSRMNRLGRRTPSTSKMRFLMHLEDCRKAGHHGVRHGLEVLDSLGTWAQEGQFISECQQRLDVLEKDLRCLDGELEKLDNDIRSVKDMLREHFQLSSDMTGFRLTALAAIFLPLSFTTSIFGMNINNNTAKEGFEGFTNFTKESLDDLPVDIKNSSQALISSVATSGPLTHDWATFAQTSLCILATLPLTLTIGWILRSVVVLAANQYIRMALIVLSVPFALISMLGLFTANMMAEYAGFSYYHDGYYTSAGIAINVAYLVCNVIFIFCVLGITYHAWDMKNRHVFWSTVAIATAVCFSLEVYGITFAIIGTLPLMPMPWIIIALGYLIPWLSSLRRELI